MQNISFIQYRCGFGAGNHECTDAPEYLQKFGLAEALQKEGINAKWVEHIPVDNSKFTNIERVAKHCSNLKKQVQDTLKEKSFPITIGGDHSMAIGTWSGVADSLYTRRKLGLIWIDAHMDSHTIKTSPSGNVHGMPISYLLGYGNDIITNITLKRPVIVPYQLCLIGIRSFEPEEAALLENLGVKIFMMDEIRKRGLAEIMLEAIKIASFHTAGFGLSIDIDGFDPEAAPGTGTREAGGILKSEFMEAIESSLSGYKECLLALEIAEYNHHLDRNNITANLIKDIIVKVLKV